MNNVAYKTQSSEVVVSNDNSQTGLVIYDAAVRALAAAKSVDEVKDWRNKSEAMRAYAKQAKNKQMETDAAEIRIRAERRLGELMAAQREIGLLKPGGDMGANQYEAWVADGPKPITLVEAGIDKHLADRARKSAAIPETEFEGIVSDWRDRIEQENERVTVNILEAGNKHVRGTLGTGENEWYTPAQFIELARTTMGSIDVDPASNPIAQSTVQASTYYTEETNGLDKDWIGNVWCNPPYAQPAIAHFADKMVVEVANGNTKEAVMLTHNYTDTAWFQKLAKAASAICFTRGRVRFESPTGEKASPTQGQAFFYFGADAGRFVDVFRDTGFVVEVK
ncbi:phage N-6-adenine-methyltransferase [Mesorhizobium sp. BR-1-1-8]|nr:phage N-6-adenine-methyltransferase [Mesorhizobium sp. BR1-1-12]MBZ9984952.1 phage N-6-adenine-methyltransferase [Mesorhizobium sp. BR-1-1-8]